MTLATTNAKLYWILQSISKGTIMEEWTVTIMVQVITPRGATEEEAKALVRPYVDAMRVTGVHVDRAVRLHSDQYLNGRDSNEQ